VWSEEGGRDIDFFICEDVDTLLYVINLGTIPLHLWASRMAKPQHPDWSIIDLDPKTAPFEDVVTLANAVHELCEEIGLPSFCKTSGRRVCTSSCRRRPAHARAVDDPGGADLAGGGVAASEDRHHPAAHPVAQRPRVPRLPAERTRKDHRRPVQRAAGPGGDRVDAAALERGERQAGPGQFTLETAPARMKRLREDPLTPVLELTPDLQAVLARLAEKLK